MYGYCLKILPNLSYSSQQKWRIQLKEILFQFLSVTCFILIFVFSATTCWTMWLYLLIKLMKLSYTVGNEFITNEKILIHPYDEVFNNEKLFYSFAQFLILFILMTSYWIYWRIDKGSEEKGSHPKKFIRNLIIWKYLADYFPIKLVLTELYSTQEDKHTTSGVPEDSTIVDLHDNSQENDNDHNDNDRRDNQTSITDCDSPMSRQQLTCIKQLFPATRNYLVGYHPHGIFGIGSFVNFLTEANQFSEKFPGITPWLTTLEINFKAPLHRDILMSFNLVSATYKGISYLLDPKQCGKTGNFVVVVLGGAPEALDSRPGKYVFHTNRRYGFFKLALLTGSDLVPCVSFGEPNMYKQVHNPEGSCIRHLQNRFTEMATFSPPLFYARCLLPYRATVNTVIGRPIYCEKNPNPTREQISILKELYLKQLQNLYNKYKPIYDPNGDLTFV